MGQPCLVRQRPQQRHPGMRHDPRAVTDRRRAPDGAGVLVRLDEHIHALDPDGPGQLVAELFVDGEEFVVPVLGVNPPLLGAIPPPRYWAIMPSWW